MKKMNKVIASMMIMAITTAVPALAGNKKYEYNDRREKVVVVTNCKKASHFDVLDRKASHCVTHKAISGPVVKSCTFRVSHHAARHHALAKAERIHGVINATWNPRTHEMTVCYDARKTTAHHIMHTVA